MAEVKFLEREYTIPLRRVWVKAAEYERGRKAIIAIKQFIAKHMKVVDRDISKVKVDVYLNNEIWFRGRRHPPAKVKVIARKEGDIVKVDFVEIPHHVRFHKHKVEKMHKKSEEKPSKKEMPPAQETKTTEEKIEEKEKEMSVAEQHEKLAKQDSKIQKHMSKKKEESYHRMALQK